MNVKEIELLEILIFCIGKVEDLSIMKFPESDAAEILESPTNLDIIL
jgi:hypothetical protein